MAAIDDATSEVLPGAHFVKDECSEGYFRVLQAVVREKGIPLTAYGDKTGILRRNDEHWTAEEKRVGKQSPTQVQRALEALGIGIIYALSPQAKGRIERLWATFQDRLVSDLRLAKASTMEEPQSALETHIREHNKRFRKAAKEEASAYRVVTADVDLKRIFSFFHKAVVQNDNTGRIEGSVIDIPKGKRRFSYVKARVEVRRLLNGLWCVYYKNEVIAEVSVDKARTVGEAMRQRPLVVVPSKPVTPKPTTRKTHKPAADHPWRERAVAKRNSISRVRTV